MKRLLLPLSLFFLCLSCSEKETSHQFTQVTVNTVYQDSVSIRAIEFLDSQTLAFAGSRGQFGTVDLLTGKVRANVQAFDSITPEFRAVAHTAADFFMLSVGSPALLYKTGDAGQMELVYKEEGEGVFYDAMKFWNSSEGIAIGDTVNGCFSIIITRDGGNTWNKLLCNKLPKLDGDTGAYAASNTNIEIQGVNTWVMTSTEVLLYSPDKGKSWNVIRTPIQIKETYQGIYSIAFYDAMNGYGIGGDFSKPDLRVSNKIKTMDGGRTWKVVGDGQEPGYKSCVQYIPNSDAMDLVAVGFTGISLSNDGGMQWKSLSDEGFYTIRFLNDSVAYAAGRNRIARLNFR